MMMMVAVVVVVVVVGCQYPLAFIHQQTFQAPTCSIINYDAMHCILS